MMVSQDVEFGLGGIEGSKEHMARNPAVEQGSPGIIMWPLW